MSHSQNCQKPLQTLGETDVAVFDVLQNVTNDTVYISRDALLALLKAMPKEELVMLLVDVFGEGNQETIS